MGLSAQEPLTASIFRGIWKEKGMLERHPRFHEKLSSDFSHFESTKSVNLTDSITETTFPNVPREDVKHRIQHLQMTPWDYTERLWRIWIAPWGALGASGVVPRAPDSAKGESLLFFQAHHVLGDGASLSAAFMDVVDEAEEFRGEVLRIWNKRKGLVKSFWQRVKRYLQVALWFFLGLLQTMVHQGMLSFHSWWDDNPWEAVKERALVESNDAERRTVSWSEVAPLEQSKWIAQQLDGPKSKITVNDIFCACASAALGRQLEEHRKRLELRDITLSEQSRLHIGLPVHLKGGFVLPGESVGNNIGAFVVRLPSESDGSAEERLREVHKELANIKKTPAALISHMLARLLSQSSMILPSSWIASVFNRSTAGAIAVVSNNRGPSKQMHIGGRRVESLYGFVPMPPGVPIGLVVMSYAGNISLTMSAESWAVPDTDQFLIWMMDEYKRLLNEAKAKSSTK